MTSVTAYTYLKCELKVLMAADFELWKAEMVALWTREDIAMQQLEESRACQSFLVQAELSFTRRFLDQHRLKLRFEKKAALLAKAQRALSTYFPTAPHGPYQDFGFAKLRW